MKITEERIDDLRRAVLAVESEQDTIWKPAHDKYRRDYTGRDGSAPTTDSKDRNVNNAFPVVEALTASSSVSGLKHIFSPKGEAEAPKAVLATGVVQHWVENLSADRIFGDANRDSKTVGMGWVELGWDFKALQQRYHAVVQKGDVDEIRRMRDLMIETFGEEAPNLTDEEIVKALEKDATHTLSAPYIRVIDDDDVFVDPAPKSMRDARWFAVRYWASLTAVQSDRAFNQTARRLVQGRTISTQVGADAETTRAWDAKSLQRVKLYKVWDVETHHWLIWAEGLDRPLLKQPWPYRLGVPLYPIPCFGRSDARRALGAVELATPETEAMNDRREDLANVRVRQMRDLYFVDDSLKRVSGIKDFFEKGNPGDAMFVTTKDKPLASLVHQIPPVQAPAELYRDSDRLEADLEKKLGLSNMQFGIPVQGTHRSVEEIAQLSRFGQARIQAMIDNTRSAWLEVGRGLLMLCQQFMTDTEAIRIRGQGAAIRDILEMKASQDLEDQGRQEFVASMQSAGAFIKGDDLIYPLDRDSFPGDFMFHLETEVAPPQTQALREATGFKLLQTLSGFPEVDRRALLKTLFKYSFPEIDPNGLLNDAGVQSEPVNLSGQASTV